jgi:hypothetical protein
MKSCKIPNKICKNIQEKLRFFIIGQDLKIAQRYVKKMKDEPISKKELNDILDKVLACISVINDDLVKIKYKL